MERSEILDGWKRVVPSALTGLRLLMLPFIAILWMQQRVTGAMVLYGLCLASDWMDGRLARRWRTSTRFGAFFDAGTDIVVILVLLGLMGWLGVVPLWLVGVPLGLAVVFLVTSTREAPRYDPVGKVYGCALYLIVGVLLWGVSAVMRGILCGLVVLFSLAVLWSRWRSFRRDDSGR